MTNRASLFLSAMSLIEVTLNQLSRLALRGTCTSCQSGRQFTTNYGPLAFQATSWLSAEPPKKKKRIDSQTVLLKEIRRKNKLEKSIKKLESRARILKPVEEIHGERTFVRTMKERHREKPVLTFEESERRVKLFKAWAQYRSDHQREQLNAILTAMKARETAMNELRKVSEQLYVDALKADNKLIPYTVRGPVYTPPVQGYEAPDGEITNTTRLFEGEQSHLPFPVIDTK